MKIQFKKERGQLIPYSDDDEQKLKKMQDGACYVVEIKNLDMRTIQQNKALHKYFSLVAEALNSRGLTIATILKADVTWSPLTIKENIWRPLQEVALKKKSTTELNKQDIDKVYDLMNLALGQKFGIHIPFPTIEKL